MQKNITLRSGRYKVVEIAPEGWDLFIPNYIFLTEEQLIVADFEAKGKRWVANFYYSELNRMHTNKMQVKVRLRFAKHQTAPCKCKRLKFLHRRTKECYLYEQSKV